MGYFKQILFNLFYKKSAATLISVKFYTSYLIKKLTCLTNKF